MKFNEEIFFTMFNSIINQLEKLYDTKFMERISPGALKHLKKAHEELKEAEKIVKERKDIEDKT